VPAVLHAAALPGELENLMVGRAGLEPATSCSRNTRAAYCATIRFSLARRNRTSGLMLPKHVPYHSAMASRWTAPDSNREPSPCRGVALTSWS
jgi:hypothetical protein